MSANTIENPYPGGAKRLDARSDLPSIAPMVFNFGSINIDHVYSVPHLPGAGETLAAISVDRFLGGKGINQSIAIARAQGQVIHIGAVGPDGGWALEKIAGHGVSTGAIAMIDQPTGHAIINVDARGENAIVILAGANGCLTVQQIEDALASAKAEEWVLLQNETNLASEIVSQAKACGCRVVYSAAPFEAGIALELLPNVDLLVVNKGEAESLAAAMGCEVENIPVPQLLVTLGSDGAFLRSSEGMVKQPAFPVKPVDTTGAGDTFLGSFLGRVSGGDSERAALEYAAACAALQVTRAGAADAIPHHEEVVKFIAEQKGK